jgi:hypothetical protein
MVVIDQNSLEPKKKEKRKPPLFCLYYNFEVG